MQRKEVLLPELRRLSHLVVVLRLRIEARRRARAGRGPRVLDRALVEISSIHARGFVVDETVVVVAVEPGGGDDADGRLLRCELLLAEVAALWRLVVVQARGMRRRLAVEACEGVAGEGRRCVEDGNVAVVVAGEVVVVVAIVIVTGIRSRLVAADGGRRAVPPEELHRAGNHSEKK